MTTRHVATPLKKLVSCPLEARHVPFTVTQLAVIYNRENVTESRDIFAMSMNRRLKPSPPSQRSDSDDFGIQNERILFLVFQSMNWDIHALSAAASVNHKLRAIAKRLLWPDLCAFRAPRMISALENSSPNGRIGGGWHTIAKLMFFCCGSESTRHFEQSRLVPGHFVKSTRFSKTSGRSFLTKECRGDELFVSDPCEHPMAAEREDDLGIFRGVFKGFHKSRTRACLIGRQVKLEEKVRCCYCFAPVWSMTAAGLVPKSAARRLGSHPGSLEYFVCVNGHMHGACWLVPLSSDENDDGEMDGSDGDSDFEGGVRRIGYADRTVTSGSMGPMGEETVEDRRRRPAC